MDPPISLTNLTHDKDVQKYSATPLNIIQNNGRDVQKNNEIMSNYGEKH